MANKRRHKGFDYEARNPAPAQPEPPAINKGGKFARKPKKGGKKK